MTYFRSFAVAALLAGGLPYLTEAASANTNSVCSYLYKTYPGYVVYDPLGSNGIKTLTNASLYSDTSYYYWNSKTTDNRATCMFFPSTTAQVSDAVVQFNKYPDVGFGLKSAGHNPNLGFSSTNGGVLISFRPNMNYTKPSADQTLADVGPGTKWGEAYATLQPYNRAVVGGRLGDIGVSGFSLGGGLSYLSAQYGLTSDNIVDYEVVLANGTIVHATSAQNPDLFWALRGGGNQFGIVTNFKMKTHVIGQNGQVWGGTRIYSTDKAPAILTAVSNFVANNKDPKAALIPTVDLVGPANLASVAVVFFFYDGLTPPSGLFDEFNAITSIADDAKTRTYPDLTNTAGAGAVYGLRFQIRENTFPNMPIANMSAFLTKHYQIWAQNAVLQSVTNLDFQILTFTVQPMPALIQEKASGSALGLDPKHGDKVWIEYDISWVNPLCDNVCPGYLERVTNQIHDMHAQQFSGIYPTKYQSGDLGTISYNPIFMNDAMYDQPVLQSYGDANYQRLKSINKKYDPTGFFANRQGGFKFTT